MPADGGVAAPMTEVVFDLSSDPDAVRDGLHRAFLHPPLCDLAEGDLSSAQIVLAEVLNNVSEHAYAGRIGPIRLMLRQGQDALWCRVEDEGVPMPGGCLPAGRLPSPADLAEGGFGWHLIRTLTRGLQYERAGGVNRLTFDLPAQQS